MPVLGKTTRWDMNCVRECKNFKYEKGWEKGYCSSGNIMDCEGRVKFFADNIAFGDNGRTINLIQRANRIKTFNKANCEFFDDMGKFI